MQWDTVDDPNAAARGLTGRGGQPIADRIGGKLGIRMTALQATDASGGAVEYYFGCYLGGNEVKVYSSGWISERTYGLVTNIDPLSFGFMFRVKARDAALNETAWSVYADVQ
jgi:hypothetical protein